MGPAIGIGVLGLQAVQACCGRRSIVFRASVHAAREIEPSCETCYCEAAEGVKCLLYMSAHLLAGRTCNATLLHAVEDLVRGIFCARPKQGFRSGIGPPKL